MFSEAYRPHFILGSTLAALGVALWPLHWLNLISYPIFIHGHIMLFGLFMSFVTGFLMTAAPRMSGTEAARPFEIYMSVALIFVSVCCSVVGQDRLAQFFAAAQILSVFAFLGGRIRKRTQRPPMGFLFVPFGLAWAFYGILFDPHGVAIQQGFLLNLIVGIGSRLIPFLTRAISVRPDAAQGRSPVSTFLLAGTLNLNLVLSYWIDSQIFYVGQVLILLAAGWFELALFRPMKERAFQALGIRLAVWSMVLAYGLLAFNPANKLAGIHILFIAGYGLLTFMIATRVVLAHGGHSLEPELKSPILAGVIGLLALTALSRSSGLLLWASGFWIVAVSLWFFQFGRKALTVKSGEVES